METMSVNEDENLCVHIHSYIKNYMLHGTLPTEDTVTKVSTTTFTIFVSAILD